MAFQPVRAVAHSARLLTALAWFGVDVDSTKVGMLLFFFYTKKMNEWAPLPHAGARDLLPRVS